MDNTQCNCFETMLKEIKQRHPKWNNKPVKDYSFAGTCIDLKSGVLKHVMVIDIEYENQKKTGTTFVGMSYCPFCGKTLNK